MNAGFLDVILILVLLMYALGGYRRGFVVTLVSMVGLMLGVSLCLWILPSQLESLVPDRLAMMRPAFLVGALFLFGAVGQMLALRLFRPLHASVQLSRARILDSSLGALITTVVAALLIWFAAGVLRSASSTSLGSAVGRSRVVSAIDALIPSTSDRILGRVVVALDSYGFPRVFDHLTAEPIVPVDPADPASARTAGVTAAGRSVLRIDALAVACGRSQEGTGFVAGNKLVVTNAHVVAGSERVTVRVGRERLEAAVVAFDPKRDLAVLSVPELTRPALTEGADLSRGAQAVVAGYPLAGPYRVDAARVRGILQANGDDIYGNGRVTREVYSLAVSIHPGNSGGPLLTTDGKVVGVIFARSLDDSGTAYALTLDELRAVTTGVDSSRQAVGTGGCTR